MNRLAVPRDGIIASSRYCRDTSVFADRVEGRVLLVAAVAAVAHAYRPLRALPVNSWLMSTVTHPAAGDHEGEDRAEGRLSADEDAERVARAGRGERLVEPGVAVVVVEVGGRGGGRPAPGLAPHEPQP